MNFELSDACQKDCGNCFRKSLIPWTAVADLSLGQNDILLAGYSGRIKGSKNGLPQTDEP
jgi:hypothetical protein